MRLTILETVVRNRERRRCFLQARRERKTLSQVVTEEGQRRLAQKLAVAMAPHIAGARTAPAPAASPRPVPPPAHEPGAPPREDVRAEVFGTNALEQPALCQELRQIGGQLARIAEELASLRSTVSRVSMPAASDAYLTAAGASAPAANADVAAAPRVPIGDVASMIDQLANAYR
jgi:hypothetical protein